MNDDRSAAATNLLLFLVGATAGALLVALTTPKSGPDLRADLREKAARLKRRAQEYGMTLCPGGAREAENEQEDEEVGI